MSVAFRRESDEEHLEPRPDLPIPVGPNLVTSAGMASTAARAAALESDLDRALADNAGEEAVKEIRRQLRYWHARRATARLAPLPDGHSVSFGTRVTYADEDGQERTATLVGHDEADPAAGRIAFGSPLARALIGCTVGDIAVFRAGGRTRQLEILSIEILDTP